LGVFMKIKFQGPISLNPKVRRALETLSLKILHWFYDA
jgi:hypothetical protein